MNIKLVSMVERLFVVSVFLLCLYVFIRIISIKVAIIG